MFNRHCKGFNYVVNVSETQRSERRFKVVIGAHGNAAVVGLASGGKNGQGAADAKEELC